MSVSVMGLVIYTVDISMIKCFDDLDTRYVAFTKGPLLLQDMIRCIEFVNLLRFK